MTSLRLSLTDDRLCICRLDPDADVPAWAAEAGGFCSITRTADELSIVCRDGSAPEGTRCEYGWRLFKVQGPFDFALTGILASVAQPLAEAGVAIFALSTYDTDYVLVKEDAVGQAVRALAAAGHSVR